MTDTAKGSERRGQQRSYDVHPNSTAARKWGRARWTTTLTKGDLAAPTTASTNGGVVELTSREEARSVACPKCHAQPGEFCRRQTKDEKDRARSHSARHAAAIRSGAKVVYRTGGKGRSATLRKQRTRDKR